MSEQTSVVHDALLLGQIHQLKQSVEGDIRVCSKFLQLTSDLYKLFSKRSSSCLRNLVLGEKIKQLIINNMDNKADTNNYRPKWFEDDCSWHWDLRKVESTCGTAPPHLLARKCAPVRL